MSAPHYGVKGTIKYGRGTQTLDRRVYDIVKCPELHVLYGRADIDHESIPVWTPYEEIGGRSTDRRWYPYADIEGGVSNRIWSPVYGLGLQMDEADRGAMSQVALEPYEVDAVTVQVPRVKLVLSSALVAHFRRVMEKTKGPPTEEEG